MKNLFFTLIKINKKLIKLTLLFLLILYYIYVFYLDIKKIILKKYNSLEIRFNLSKEFNKIFSILYDLSINKKLTISFDKKYKNSTYSTKKKKGIYVCVQGKQENLYVKDFVEYYKQIGFDKIIILDNNNINDENLEDLLKGYINNKFVDIINIRELESIQVPAYNFCYQKYINKFDWIIFIDFDEYLYIKNYQKINQYIYSKKYKKCQSILINRIIYDDNDLEKYDSRPLIKRFIRRKELNKTFCLVKTIVRGGIKNLVIPNVHFSGINIQYICNSEGERVFPTSLYPEECNRNSSIIIKHFFTKTAKEFCNKIKRGDAHFNENNPFYKYVIMEKINNFFFINKITKNKINILEKCLKLNLNIYRKKLKQI